ncbi:MAG: DUF1223 domain-containing protein [Xanthobacteraceae bacterium]|nr:DUF1223 domain-containing protein [Xanthobacteraceae bacterium]
MHVFRILGVLAVLAAMTGWSSSPALAGGKTVVELFTSQGCNSCPPADKLLGRLTQNPNVIPLTLAVDYWDYLGWKDTLALHGHTLRQRNYAKVRGDMNVYTPQAIVNGVKYAVGSDEREISAALRNHPGNEREIPLTVKRDGDNITVDVGASEGKATVWLVTVKNKIEVQIARGENKGETISYFNVVRSWRNLGAYSGSPIRTSVPVGELTKDGADAVVVFVQNGAENSPGAIRNAEIVALR